MTKWRLGLRFTKSGMDDYLSESERRRVFDEADSVECVACGGTERLGVDHKTPGGGIGNDNLQLLCQRCNASKNYRTMREWIAMLKRRRSAAAKEFQRTDQILSRIAPSE